MVVSAPLTPSAVDLIAVGVFSKPDPLVVEAYSEPDREPLSFSSHAELVTYIEKQISEPRGLAFVFVVYPDMRGRPVRKTIQLDPKHCPGQKLRYTWDGWGLISI
jgi:YD repeat-containing protein